MSETKEKLIELATLLLVLAAIGAVILIQHNKIDTLTTSEKNLTAQVEQAKTDAKNLAKVNADNLEEARKQARAAQDMQAIAEQERDQALKRTVTHTTIQANIANAKPSDREAPVPQLVIDTINQLYP